MKYRYVVVHEGTVDAESEEDAPAHALVMSDGGFAEATAVQVEAMESAPQRREDGSNG